MNRTASWWTFCLAQVALVILIVACSGPSPTETPIPTPRQVFIPTPVTPEPTPTARPGTTRVNLDAMAPPGTGRDLLMMNCGNCHSFVCAFRGQRTLGHWELVLRMHKAEHWVYMDENELEFLFSYLEANFNDQKPVPEIPDVLADQGCTTPALR